MKLFLTGSVLLSSLFVTAQSVVIRPDEVNGLSLKFDFEKQIALKLSDKNDLILKKGDYIIRSDEASGKDRNMEIHLSVNDQGQPDGAIQSFNPDNRFIFSGMFREGTLISYSKENEGQLIEEGYFKNDTCYMIYYDDDKLRNECRYVAGEKIYSKNINLSGWDIQDEVKGTRTFYYGTTDKIEEHFTYKGLPKGIESMKETYDETGELNKKEIAYSDGKTKNIFGDGSYEIETIEGNGVIKVKRYSKNGKLTDSYETVSPAAPAPPPPSGAQ